MTATEKLYQLIQTLSEEQINQILYFAEFLHHQQLTTQSPQATGLKNIVNHKQLRPFGLCAGDFVVPDDFDAPLPEDVLNAFEGK